MSDRFERAAWDYVQEMRRYLGYDPATRLPKGIPTLVTWDPVSMALCEGQIDPELETWVTTERFQGSYWSGYSHDYRGWLGMLWIICSRIEDEYLITRLPVDVTHFVNRWASGFYPDLVL